MGVSKYVPDLRSNSHITQSKTMAETVLLDGYSLSPEVLVSLQEGFKLSSITHETNSSLTTMLTTLQLANCECVILTV